MRDGGLADQDVEGSAAATEPAAHLDAGPVAELLDEAVPPPPRSGPDFPALDALRAVGALAVVTTHVAFWSALYTGHGTVGALLARLDSGVALFFVLSGFLLARPWFAAAAEGRPGPRVTTYLRRRLWRIAPLYVVTAVLALGLVAHDRDLGWGEQVRTVLMLNTFTDRALPPGLTQMWSLAVEVSCYLVLPLLMLVLLGRRPGRLSGLRVGVGLVGLVAVSVWWYVDGAARAGAHTSGLPLQWLPGYLTWFAAGMALAWMQVAHARGDRSRVTRTVVALAGQPGSCWALAAGLMLVAATPVAGPTMLEAPTLGQELTKSLLYAGAGTLIVLTGVFPRAGSTYERTLAHPAARRLGWISFGVFCLHLPVLHLVMGVTGWTVFHVAFGPLWLATVAVSLVAAELGYRLVERPGIRIGRRLEDRAARRRGAAQPSSSATSVTSVR